ncbi:autotransporter outer membrane beta-barrel domain-containing protein [Helicobacter sp. 11S02596-1]|uniref:autotransporter outer membrane beta-barrel domain-containing protein n=1 Tax=Helicobacter sp. 11S02596-1 TaxID=1476194 RepID=UPI000BDCC247|nr:autotransporter outer membrane beta-barrel domain-containing protein [Helicobacter sp. 11S02596-1]PAF44787.1 hypothetical protein BJI48_02020 [Helicobacter sp. 11S02596-1]
MKLYIKTIIILLYIQISGAVDTPPMLNNYPIDTNLDFSINFTEKQIISSDTHQITIGPGVTLNTHIKVTANEWKSDAAGIFKATGKTDYLFGGGANSTWNIFWDFSTAKPAEPDKNQAIFMSRKSGTTDGAHIIFDTNTIFNVADNSNLARGVFNANGSASNGPNTGGIFDFRQNLIVNVSNARAQESHTGDWLRAIFKMENHAAIYVNYDPDTGTTRNPNNIIQLQGDIDLDEKYATKGMGSDSNVYMNLTNPESFFIGRTAMGYMVLNLTLENGGKYFLTGSTDVKTLSFSNPAFDPSKPFDVGDLAGISYVDFSKYASSNTPGPYCLSGCARSDEAYAPRILKVNRIDGNGGLFLLSADPQNGISDRIEVNNLEGVHYIYLDTYSPLKDSPKMVVANAQNVAAGAGFEGTITRFGLYDYLPTFDTAPGATGGTDFIVGAAKTMTPSDVSKDLFGVFSIPYLLFRLGSDSLHSRIEDLFNPLTIMGAWAKINAGGIYANNFATGSKTFQNPFTNVQIGYDGASLYAEDRFFYGGTLEYTKLRTGDKQLVGYDGNVNSFGFGAYGGLVDKKGLVVDVSAKYIYGAIHQDIYRAGAQGRYGGHIFLLNTRFGYNFYPLLKTRYTTRESCVGGKFCRNVSGSAQVRDDSLYIQPYISFIPAMMFSSDLAFRDMSNAHIRGHLDFTPAFIGKIGVLGVKNYDLGGSNINAKASIEYSQDLTSGGKATLVDDVNIPLEHRVISPTDHRVGLGIGGDWVFLNDTLKLSGEFKTEFFGHINTYWLFSFGLRYKFGEYVPKARRFSKEKPDVMTPQRFKQRNPYKPYQPRYSPPKTFHDKNHFAPY